MKRLILAVLMAAALLTGCMVKPADESPTHTPDTFCGM